MNTEFKDIGAAAKGWTNWRLINSGYKLKCVKSVLNEDGRIEVFGITTSQELICCHQTDLDANGWSDWLHLRSEVDYYDLCTYEDGRIILAVIDRDNTLRTLTQKNPNVTTEDDWVISATHLTVKPCSISFVKDYYNLVHLFWCDEDRIVRWSHQHKVNEAIALEPNLVEGDTGSIVCGRGGNVDMNALPQSRKFYSDRTAAGLDMFGRVNVFAYDKSNHITRNGVRKYGSGDYMRSGDDVRIEGDPLLVSNGNGEFEIYTVFGGVINRVSQSYPSGKWGYANPFNDSPSDYYPIKNFDGRVSVFMIVESSKLFTYLPSAINSDAFDVIDMKTEAVAVSAVQNVFGFTTCIVCKEDGSLVMSVDTKKGEAPKELDWHQKMSEDSDHNIAALEGVLAKHKPTFIEKKLNIPAPLNEVFQVTDHVLHWASKTVDKGLHTTFFEAKHFENMMASHVEVAEQDIHKLDRWVEDDLSKLLGYGKDLLTDIDDVTKFDRVKATQDIVDLFFNIAGHAVSFSDHIGMHFPVDIAEFKKNLEPLLSKFPDKILQRLHVDLPEADLSILAEVLKVVWVDGLSDVRRDIIWGIAGAITSLNTIRAAVAIIVTGFPCKLGLGLNLHIAGTVQGGAALTANIGVGVGVGVDADIPVAGAGAEGDGGAGNVTVFDANVASISLSELVLGPVIVTLDFLIQMLQAASYIVREHWQKQS